MGTYRRKNHMVWIDLEMTGLDPKKERIIEIATIVTDSNLEIIDQGPNLIIHQAPKLLKAMDRWNKTQHKKSGLIEAVKASCISEKQAEEKTLLFLRKYCYAGTAPLCGNSVHHDRRFLDKYMPRISRFLHYRHIDVSTIKELVSRWYSRIPNGPKKKENHRALDDIVESIEELKFFQKHFFKRQMK